MARLVNGRWVLDNGDILLMNEPVKADKVVPAVVGTPPLAAVAAAPPVAVPVAAAPIAPAAVVKSASAARDLYCQSVFNAWSAYDAEVRQIYSFCWSHSFCYSTSKRK